VFEGRVGKGLSGGATKVYGALVCLLVSSLGLSDVFSVSSGVVITYYLLLLKVSHD
jgi:hypothetical protein